MQHRRMNAPRLRIRSISTDQNRDDCLRTLVRSGAMHGTPTSQVIPFPSFYPVRALSALSRVPCRALTSRGAMVAGLLLSVGNAAAQTGTAVPSTPPATSTPAASPAATPAAGFDPATGKQNRSYPPHRTVDHKHMSLSLMIPDMQVPRAKGLQRLTVSSISGPTEQITLDARALVIESVSCQGHTTNFTHDGRHLTIMFDPPLEQDKDAVIETTYIVDHPPLGLIWTPTPESQPERAAQLHTQGQPQTNNYWFPCHDYPNDRLTTELIVTVPAEYEVSSNGRRLSKVRVVLPDNSGTLGAYHRWHFLQSQPHVNYLVSLVVGRFDIVNLESTAENKSALPLPVYAPVGRGKDVAGTFKNTPAMIDLFSKVLDEPYPWDKYAQLIVTNFGAGGMENTSATTLFDTAIIAPQDLDDHDLDGLISHELAHQWFGDLITCNSWEHVWLNEGFATYLTSLWLEHRDGRSAYEQYIRGNFDSVIGADKPLAPAQVGMVSKVYDHPWETFRRPSNPYSKGSAILHMLRAKLGDDLFFKGVVAYVEKHKFTTVETSDLRNAFEGVSGASLEQFFAQWCYRPGVPSLNVTNVWSEAEGTLTCTVEQTQTVDADNPAFEFDLPLSIMTGGDLTNKSVEVRGKSTTLVIPLKREPQAVAVDPAMAVLADITLNQPTSWLLVQLTSGPTGTARAQAARAFKKQPQPGGFAALSSLVKLNTNPTWLRVEALRGLLASGEISNIRSFISTYHDAWELREAIVQEIPALATKFVDSTPSLQNFALHFYKTDSSLKVKCAALRSLGQTKSDQAIDIIKVALRTESQSDGLRQAALEAAASLDDEALLADVIALANDGYDGRTQAVAAATIAKLAHHDSDKAFAALETLLKSPNMRVNRAAGEALVAMRDPRALPLIESIIEATRAEEIAWQGAQWLKALRASNPPATQAK